VSGERDDGRPRPGDDTCGGTFVVADAGDTRTNSNPTNPGLSIQSDIRLLLTLRWLRLVSLSLRRRGTASPSPTAPDDQTRRSELMGKWFERRLSFISLMIWCCGRGGIWWWRG
jgi:hypothetical protein